MPEKDLIHPKRLGHNAFNILLIIVNTDIFIVYTKNIMYTSL